MLDGKVHYIYNGGVYTTVESYKIQYQNGNYYVEVLNASNIPIQVELNTFLAREGNVGFITNNKHWRIKQ
jgi:hypothetical protein